MPRIEDVFNTKELINYFKERTITPMLGESLFPERKIQDIEFDMILGSGGLPVSASVHAFDTKTQMASREAIEKGVASLALIKRQIKIAEKEIIKINNPRTNAELTFVLSQLYNDSEKMVQAVKVRVEAMRMEVLSTGKLKIEENGVKVTLDYGIPSANKKSFNWSDPATSKPLDDLTTLADAVEDTSIRPTRALTSRKLARAICNSHSVRAAIHGVNSDKIVSLAQLNELLEQLNLPQIVTYEGKYKVEKAKGFDTKRYFPDNIIAMFGDGPLGETIYGLTAEEVKLIGDGKMDMAEMVDKIFVGTYTSIDPVGEFTKAAATALPSLPHGEELGIGTITL
ncbi:major capsid protein [Clostridium botulinum]|uniref:Major capsid protein E n=1 Tax=Clostridium botulinum TaxID=1491 RepID=A0A6G4ED85_CLOBO|nr:major capsid protein [Clostridium botulinum]AUM91513.1 major capsid protein E [Clostridium botulinum]NFB12911.1 major capsid protein E [Clostridium botulinum]NFH57841.1 major capsid protein E [Clostridium botulinum]NFH61196.1 major capsid protein E [Clostridium botulinum]NFJ87286.1 major capsid protein E [Clostridium botulinum]